MTCRMDNSRTVGDTDSPQLEKTGNNLTYGKKLLKNCIEVWHIYRLHVFLSISSQKERNLWDLVG